MEDDKEIQAPTPDDDKSLWKLGIFYFNPKDKRIFPPKRVGIGWTVNFANPFSVAALIILVVGFIYLNSYIRRSQVTPH